MASHRFNIWAYSVCNLSTLPSSTTVETNTTSLSTLPLNKIYNFEVVYKYNIMKSLSQKLKSTESKIARVTRCQFFCLSDIFSIVGLFQ